MSMTTPRHRCWIGLFFVSAALGCAGPGRSKQAEPATAAGPKGQAGSEKGRAGQERDRAGLGVAGVWDWVHRSQAEGGDLRIEQEEWHIEQQDGKLSGYYDRQVVMLSGDQRPYRCNGALGFTKTTRVRLQGMIQGQQVHIREVAADTQQHPCDTGQRALLSYIGQLQGDSLLLRFPPGGTQFLTRRPPGLRMAGIAGPGSAQGPGNGPLQDPAAAALAARVPVSGVWEWELQSVDADGDLRVEREEWHVEESDANLTGYYERTVVRERPGGTFQCNGKGQIHSVTQYKIRGQRFGDRLTVSEIDYRVQPGPCDNTMRRLDTYQGTISPTGQEILLSWGPGSQLLKRRAQEGR